MKKLLITSAFLTFGLISFAQSDAKPETSAKPTAKSRCAPKGGKACCAHASKGENGTAQVLREEKREQPRDRAKSKNKSAKKD